MEEIQKALDKIRPALQNDGGDVEIVSFDEQSGVLTVKYLGHCVGCPFAQMTLKQGIEKSIKELVPAVKVVELAE